MNVLVTQFDLIVEERDIGIECHGACCGLVKIPFVVSLKSKHLIFLLFLLFPFLSFFTFRFKSKRAIFKGKNF